MSSSKAPSWSLEGKVAVVTGSGKHQFHLNLACIGPANSFSKGRGMGRETALELARRGADVAVNYANSADAAEEAVKEIQAMGRKAVAIKANVANVSETIELMEQVVKQLGKLDICASNSGVVSFGHLKDITEEEFDRVYQINTRGQLFVAREAYKHMEVGGRIILMGSITGQAKGVPKHIVYSSSKGAIETMVRCMAIGTSDINLPSFSR